MPQATGPAQPTFARCFGMHRVQISHPASLGARLDYLLVARASACARPRGLQGWLGSQPPQIADDSGDAAQRRADS